MITFKQFITEAYQKKSARSKDPKAWVNDNYGRVTETVPISWVNTFPGNAMRKTPEQMAELTADVKKNGIREPLIITVGQQTGTAKLGEGNHRLEAARRAGFTHVPVTVMVGRQYGSDMVQYGSKRNDLIIKPDKYYPANAKPSAVFSSLKRKKRAVYPQDN